MTPRGVAAQCHDVRMGAREVAKTVLTKVPPLYRLAANVASGASRGHRLRAVGRTIRYDLQTRMLKRPTLATIGSRSRIIVYPGETNGPHAAYRSLPNWPEMGVWQQHLRPGDLFVDVGANIGIYTLFALDLGAEVIACEPDRRNAARIRENLALNGYAAPVIQQALSNEPGLLRFTQGLDSYNHIVLHGDSDRFVEVEATTLDDVLGDRTAAGVKVDVEGAERLVVEGARRALTEKRIRLLQLEWSAAAVETTLGERRDVVAELLHDAGYRLYRPHRGTAELVLLTGDIEPGKDVFAVPS